MENIAVSQVPNNHPSKWNERFDYLVKNPDKAIILSPEDSRQAHILRTVAYQTATRLGERVKTRLVNTDGQLKLYIWLNKF